MKGEAKKLVAILSEGDTAFVIPIYQRNYDWKQSNCDQLFSDLVELHKSGKGSHFFGSIVSSTNPMGERIIIDGQQRITTISLLLIALVNAYNEGMVKADNPKLTSKIFTRYLTDEYKPDVRKVRLKPILKDMEAFDALLYNKKKTVETSNVTRNYNFLYDKIKKSGLKLDNLLGAVEKLEVIDIKLDNNDDPQLIFESLNSTGLDLSEADKIRNYLLMSLSQKEQDDMYERYWNPIEENTEYEPSSFVRYYLTMKCRREIYEKKIYFEFKDYCQKVMEGKIAVLKDMHHYAKIYHNIIKAQMGDMRLDRKLTELNVLNFTVAYPFYMAFFDYANKKGMTQEDKYEVIDLMENFFIRRIIRKMPSNALNKIFATLHGDVLRLIGEFNREGTQYIDVLKYYLLARGGSASFPNDTEIQEEFPNREVYKLPLRQRLFLFERLENRDSNERHDVVSLINKKEISIEHIMPQNLSNDWKKDLGPDWQRIHQQYLHTLANLTLTGYNSEYSNFSFIKKRDMEKGFNDSVFRLNSFVKTCDKWTEEELLARQKELLNVFLKLWPMPKTGFKLPEKPADTVSLDDEDYDFRNKKLIAYTYRGARQTVQSWKMMLVNICAQVAQENRSAVEWLCANKKLNFTNEDNGRSIEKIGSNLYVETNSSTDSKINMLRHLFDECEIPQSDLVFEFSQQANDNED